MATTAICWLLIAALCAQPLLGRRRWRRFLARRAIPGERERMYRRGIVRSWILTALWGLALALQGTSLWAVALRAPESQSATRDVLVALLFVAALVVPLLFARMRRLNFRLAGDVVELLPRTGRERAWFVAVALTAGFCEELLYRNFPLAVLSHFVHAPPWWAYFVVGSVPFGLAHLYQGRRGVVLTAVFGLWATSLYFGWRSLWPAIVAHALVDLRAGALSYWLAPSAEAAASDRAVA